MSTTNKRFDEWNELVDCNECELYYLNQCDGVPVAQKRSCTSFKATRHISIPQELKWLKTRLKWLYRGLGAMGVILIGLSIIILKYYFGI